MKKAESSSRERFTEVCLGKWVGFGETEMQGEGPCWNGGKSSVSGEHCPVPSVGQNLVPVTGCGGGYRESQDVVSLFCPRGQKCFRLTSFIHAALFLKS